ncbi:hemerythrin domain-containing protein [Micromonospora sp. NPDC047548]|uniref:hemerythrin domain-containing protein n=1 Tax=Micromonospora sp. NPDC047548 TaxID=3155624 RepID=UPI0034103EED
MCHDCGCRSYPIIDALSDEHEQINSLAGRLRRAVIAGADPAPVLAKLVPLINRHTAAEERGLFAGLRGDPQLSVAIDELCAEHLHLHQVLADAAAGTAAKSVVLVAIDTLRRHIDKEEYGIFPAAAILLDADGWERLAHLSADDALGG